MARFAAMTEPTATRWRLVSYHPTWGEDWRHFETYYDAVRKRAELLAQPNNFTSYKIVPVPIALHQ